MQKHVPPTIKLARPSLVPITAPSTSRCRPSYIAPPLMPASQTGLIALRSSPSHNAAAAARTIRLCSPHLTRRRNFFSPFTTMLRDANKAFAAVSSKPAPAKNSATKSFFMSSSKQPNHDIRTQLGRPSSGGTSTAAAATTAMGREDRGASSTNYKPLDIISGNAFGQTSGTRTYTSASKGRLMDLYAHDHAGSFDDAPGPSVELPPPASPPAAKPSIATPVPTGVELNEDDFDDPYDLEYEEPMALPPAPKDAPLPQSKATVNPPTETTTLQSEGLLSWPSSSSSHYAPPAGRTNPLLNNGPSLKRGSSGDAPAAKRRVYPPSFNDGHRDIGTPAPKARGPYNPELTASAFKEQKKKLKCKNGKEDDQEDATTLTREQTARITKPNTTKSVAITLSAEQKNVLDLVVNHGRSVFFTGPAGTGKSVLMRAIIEELRQKHHTEPERVAVTASTGFAACNIGGITLHSFAGIGLGKDDAPTLVKKVRRNAVAKQRWLKTKCLIIDEVSMVDGDLFDKLSQIGRQVRGNGRPWGGIQLIITGDFFQLPPVPEGGRDCKFAFDAATWNTAIDHTIGLTQVFRQKDPVFANMLNEMRLGRIDPQTAQVFRALERPLPTDDIEATELFPTRYEVESANGKRLLELKGETRHFTAMDSGRPEFKDRLLQNMMAPKTLTLKVGAQVMLIKNLDENLVNGTQGTVVGFCEPKESQNGEDAPTKAKIREFSNMDRPKGTQYPLVEFQLSSGHKQRILCEPHDWKVELPNGEVQASRKQVPLILAWALSIHKAQGQTLERVRVNLHKAFENGQAYVALSRATSQEGLQVLGFDPSKVMAHHRVIEFYGKLYSVDQVLARRSGGLITGVTLTAAVAMDSSAVAPKPADQSTAPKRAIPAQAQAQVQARLQARPAPSRTASTARDKKQAALA